MDWGTVSGWLGDLDWNAVSGVLGGASLILALSIFRRDRRNAERSQVDLVGAWGEASYARLAPGDDVEVVQANIRMHLRNGSELPVTVKRLAYEIDTRWMKLVALGPSDVQPGETEEYVRSYDVIDGTEPYRAFVDDVQLAPGETEEASPYEVNLEHLAPEGCRQLAIDDGVTVRVAWLLLIDNAGRRWVVKAHKGRRARKVPRWWWRPEEHMPARW